MQGNTSNIVFLKSTDDSMLDTLEKMSGKCHRVYRNSKNVTKDNTSPFWQIDPKVTFTYAVVEEPVIQYNDLAFLPERNSIVFRAGDPVVWNRNDMILPMSWRLFKNTIIHPGHEYSLQTIPTLSSALDFDLRKNQPNFMDMLEHRLNQAYVAEEAMEKYKKAYGYSDEDILRMDPDVYADEIMDIIDSLLEAKEVRDVQSRQGTVDRVVSQVTETVDASNSVENTEQIQATQQAQVQQQQADQKRYAGKTLGRSDLCPNGTPNHAYDIDIIKAFKEAKNYFGTDTVHFRLDLTKGLYSADMKTLYISRDQKAQQDTVTLNTGEGVQVVQAKQRDTSTTSTYIIHDEFYKFLVAQDNWYGFAGGMFEQEMRGIMGRAE